jgi:hypothetical protein
LCRWLITTARTLPADMPVYEKFVTAPGPQSSSNGPPAFQPKCRRTSGPLSLYRHRSRET